MNIGCPIGKFIACTLDISAQELLFHFNHDLYCIDLQIEICAYFLGCVFEDMLHLAIQPFFLHFFGSLQDDVAMGQIPWITNLRSADRHGCYQFIQYSTAKFSQYIDAFRSAIDAEKFWRMAFQEWRNPVFFEWRNQTIHRFSQRTKGKLFFFQKVFCKTQGCNSQALCAFQDGAHTFVFLDCEQGFL